MTVRKYFAEEKQNALEDLDAYFSALKMTDYTEENQKKLAEIMDEAKAEIENADIIGMADRLFLESIDRLKEVEPIIRQKIPSIEIKPTPSALVKGQKLSESRLTGGKAETEGTFSWKDGSVIPLQTGNYPVIFTPKDTEAYLPVEFDVTVSVTDPVPSPDIPDSPDSKPDLTPPSESAPPVDSPLTPDSPSQSGPTVGLDQVHTENQPNGSGPTALGTVLESDPSSASDAGANGTPDKGPGTDEDTVSSGDAGTGEDAVADGGTENIPEETKPQTRDTFILVALLIAGVVVVAGISFFVIRKRK